jgi:hypothetical protein
MIIHSTGNVGIGTTNPSQLLDVRGNMYSQGISVVDSTYYTNQYQLSISPPTSTTGAIIQTIQQGINYNQNLNLQPNGGTITLTGATTCSSTLTVNGAINANGNSLVFPNTLSDCKITLFSGWGFDIQANELKYMSGGNHKFYNSTTNTFTIDGSGNTSSLGSITAGTNIVSNSGISTFKSIYIANPNNSVTHFPFTNGQNYIGGKLNIDQDDLYVGGLTTINNVLT